VSTALDSLLAPVPGASAGAGAVAVVAVRGEERTVLCRGARPDTRFEVGSVTKTFTALLLAEMAARKEVRYDDPVARYLPHGVPGPPITLMHLATHTSGRACLQGC
jgi:CubicO group peptidase (beta-lactamase class C family)